MDDRLEYEHDFKKTLREAADLDSDVSALDRERKTDAEIAYETLAVNSAMGYFGLEENGADLLMLTMTDQIRHKAEKEAPNSVSQESDELKR